MCATRPPYRPPPAADAGFKVQGWAQVSEFPVCHCFQAVFLGDVPSMHCSRAVARRQSPPAIYKNHQVATESASCPVETGSEPRQ